LSSAAFFRQKKRKWWGPLSKGGIVSWVNIIYAVSVRACSEPVQLQNKISGFFVFFQSELIQKSLFHIWCR
jgi:hypothetical protein